MYLVDSNVLIEAKNRYYAFDIAPGFWAWLDQAHQQSLACSIEAVRDELLRPYHLSYASASSAQA
jgi:PIN domain protein